MLTANSSRPFRHHLGVVLTLGLLPAAYGEGILYVDDDAPAAGDGASWETAYRFLQDALAAAEAAGDGVCVIRVGQGVYTPDRDEANPDGTGDRSVSFGLLAAVAIEGGYAGLGAEDPNDRDVNAHPTVLSGDLLSDDGRCFVNIDENSYHVAVGHTADVTSTLDGFTISGGNANGDGSFAQGGGFHSTAVGPQVRQCTFEGNTAHEGGGAYVAGSGSFTDCTFRANEAEWYGGGLVSSSWVITRGVFDDNTSFNQGGGLWAQGQVQATTTVVDSIFTRNHAGVIGGGAVARSFCQMDRCVFSHNSATSVGGLFTESNTVSITSTLFVGNFSHDLHGAVALFPGTMTNCTVVYNHSPRGSGGVYIDGPGRLRNCISWDNRTGGLPGNMVVTDTPEVSYCDVGGGYPGPGNIDENPAFVAGPTGTWTTNATYDADLDVTVFTDDDASYEPGALFASSMAPNIIVAILRYPVLGNTETTITAPGDLTSLGAAGATYDIFDHHLAAGSPCIDAADSTVVPKEAVLDLDGDPRFVDDPDTPDTGVGDPVVDMGADEFHACRADLDGSGVVDFADLIAILGAWGPCKGCPQDLDGDGFVGFSDIIALLEEWGPC